MQMIARRLELDFKTVRRYLRADSVEQLIAGGVRVSRLDPFKLYLHQRLSADARNAAALHAEIVNRGYTGSYPTLERYLKPLRRSDAATLTQVLRNRPPAVRQVTGWITGLPGHLDPADKTRLKAIRARCPQIGAAVKHVAGFARMIKDLSGDKDTLTGWMAAVDHDLPTLRSFTRGLRRDLEGLHRRADPAIQLRRGGGHRQQDQGPEDAAVRTCQPRPAAETDLAGVNVDHRHPPTPRVTPRQDVPRSPSKTYPQPKQLPPL